MRRRIVLTSTAVLTSATLLAASAASAAPAKKIKVKKGSYTVTALPDPTMEATGEAGMECYNIDPQSADNHPLTLPGKGLLQIVLDSPDPSKNHMDWDLHLLDSKGNIIASSNGGTAHEEIDMPNLKGKVVIRSCNLAGEPTATVNWTFSYR